MEGSETLFGLLESFGAVLLFGSMFLPIKVMHIDTGDGVYAHFIMCIGALITSFVVYVFEGFPQFFPYAMLGGAMWGINNFLSVIVIHEIGLGMTAMILSTGGVLANFSISYFGLFGTAARPPSTQWLAFVGIALILIGGVVISLVKNKRPGLQPMIPLPKVPTLPRMSIISLKEDVVSPEEGKCDSPSSEKDERPYLQELNRRKSVVEHIEPAKGYRRYLFITLAFIAGLVGAYTVTPMVAMLDNPEVFVGYPSNPLLYLYSILFGAFLQGVATLIVYSFYMHAKLVVNPTITIPAFVSGAIFGAAMIFSVLSTMHLSQAINGPIVCVGPACVASLWSVFYFREIEAGKSIWLLGIAISIIFAGSVAIGLSK